MLQNPTGDHSLTAGVFGVLTLLGAFLYKSELSIIGGYIGSGAALARLAGMH